MLCALAAQRRRCEEARHAHHAPIEIELRFGVIDRHFESGVDQDEWQRVRDVLEKSDAIRTDSETEDHVADGVRHTFRDGTLVESIEKIRLAQQEFAEPAQMYDARLSIAVERPSLREYCERETTFVRHKYRTSYTYPNRIRVDLTRVLGDRVSLECEIEFLWPASLAFTEKRVSMVALALEQCRRTLMPTHERAPLLCEPYVHLERRASALVCARVRELCRDSAPARVARDVARTQRFPGALPVTLSRRDIESIDHTYYVCDKSDGLRLMLLVDHNGAFFVDRRFTVYRLPISREFERIRHGTILLDGELVLNERTRRKNYVVFDAVCVNDQTMRARTLSERLAVFSRQLMVPLRRDRVELPFDVVGKPMWPFTQIHALLKNYVDRDGRRLYTDERRCHEVDGLILVPNERGVRPFTCAPRGDARGTFKWKYEGLHTVDLLVHDRPLSLHCLIDTQHTQEIVKGSRFCREDAHTLSSLVNKIVEVSYDVTSAQWRFHQVRPQKEAPNHIVSVIGTLESAAERVGLHELIVRATR